VSFHNNQEDWGIYIPLSSVAFLDELYFGNLPIDRDERIQLGWSALLAHEQFHFAIDHACAWFELMLRAPIRREFTARFKSKPQLSAAEVSETYLEVEETAANAHMIRYFRRTQPRQIVQTIEQFVERQPPAYREGLNAIGDSAFARAVADTLRSYVALWAMEYRLDLGSPALNLSQLLPLADENTLAECPIHTLDDLEEIGVSPGSIRFIQCIPHIVETEDFGRQFRCQSPAVQRDWSRTKEQIKIHVPPAPRFKKLKNWDPPTFSLRLRGGYRVHLLPPDRGTEVWHAVRIGNHGEMGHG
jgi:hypothetical protein